MKNKIRMKSKFFLTVAIAFFVFASLGSVLAKDIAYISRDASHVDSSITSLLEDGNYTYDVIYQTSLDSTNFSKYKIILVGDGIFNDPLKVPVNIKNSVILNTYHMDEWLWTGKGVSTKSSNYPTQVYVYDQESSITQGVGESFIPYNNEGSITSYNIKYIPKSLDAPGLNTIVVDGLSFLSLLGIYTPKNGAVVGTIENGSMLRGNQVSKARGIFLGFPETNLWTEPVKSIFYNSIEWAMNGEDRDGDGFFSDEDCNDSDAEINPDGTEIPYDGIDQDCVGGDLNDLDEDGFVGEPAGGNDCDDEDASYNINSTDLTKNCINDAPIINEIYRISVHETETAILQIDSYDSEGDALTYTVNDSRFVQDGEEKNVFSWETGYEDEGDYKFFAIVSDGEFSSEKQFLVKVWNKNKAPELLMDVPVQEWEEDTNHTLNLTKYFYDLDGNNLIYLIHDTSSDSNVHLKKIENGVAYFDSKNDWYGEDWIIFKATDGDGTISPTQTNNITLRVLPVNDAPRLIKEIGTVELDEDETYYLDLSDYIEDVDSELEYSFENTTHVTLSIDGNVLQLTPEENWYGEEEAGITAGDGEFELSDDFLIRVVSVNDAPEVNPIEDKFLLAGDKVEISASATDIEGDEFTFSVNDSRFVQDELDNSSFSWQTGKDDFGVYTFKVGAYDGESYGYTNVKVNVLQKIFINEFVWGNEGWVELYNPKSLPFSLSNCALSNGDEELILYGNLGNKGFAVFGWNALKNQGDIELSCNGILMDMVEYDEFNNLNSLGRMPDGSTSSNPFILFNYPTRGVSNSADVTKPEIELNSPANNTLYTETREVLFEFTPVDNLAEEMECSIIANLKALETGNFENNTLGSFYIDYLKDGVYLWNIECSDGSNKNTGIESWMINISAPDNPILNYIGNRVVSENTELRFFVYATDQDKDSIELRTSELPEGASFTDNGNGNGLFVWKPNYNQSGSYTVKFTAEDNTGLEDSEEITMLVGNAKEPPKFSDADVCSEDARNNSIELSIKDPDDGDDFDIGDTISGTLKIKNELEDDMSFDVKIYLYDIKEEQSVEDFDDSVDIDEGKSENIEFSMEIPKDIENKEFAIYAYVEGEDEECNSAYVEIEINRKKHEVIISEITTDREEVSPGEEV
ncbi:MAG: Ig-like domain-containing protein, partial [Candidatus Pacearchaeota archaeon]|nr:Ig-like domain-containing protein [Candidatus Pacearchaeota archaeon]